MDPVRRSSGGLQVAVAEPEEPVRATIYALHGGGLNGDYWDCALDPALSLVRLAAKLGLRVAHPDRPGHRANAEAWPEGLPPGEEAALHAAAIAEWWPDEPVLLLGHSTGAIVALHLAAKHATANLIGVDYSGIGIHLDPGPDEHDRRPTRFWGPLELYPAATFEPGGRPSEPTTVIDATSARTWGDVFAEVAPLVAPPVRITFADHESWWGPVEATLAEVAAGYVASAEVGTTIEHKAGHNVSLGWAARSYHLRVAAFAERCLRRHFAEEDGAIDASDA